MSTGIDMRPRDLAIVRAILAQHLPSGSSVWVFGSRANGRTRRSSDLDLLVDAGRRLTPEESRELSYAFEKSDLPYTVDIVDRHAISLAFRAVIESKLSAPISVDEMME